MDTMAPKPKPRRTVLGKRLEAIRVRLGEPGKPISQRAAGELIGVSMETWHSWEVRGKKPSKSSMMLINLLEAGKL